MNKWLRLSTFLLLVVLMPWAWAEDDGEEGAEAVEAAPKRAIYIPIKPPFVVNYGGVGNLRYMKVEVSLRVEDSQAANSVRHHLPYIRNNLILLFSAQNEEKLDTLEGKELLRQEALAEVGKILEVEDGSNGVVDLYFNQMVLQK